MQLVLRLLHAACLTPALPPGEMQAILLALSCLSFDFVGTCIDDSAEEIGTIQVG